MTKNNLKKKLGDANFEVLEKTYEIYKNDYEKFLSHLEIYIPILASKGVKTQDVCAVFPIPIAEMEIATELDENGDPLEDALSIPGPGEPLLEKVTKKGWIKPQKEKELLNSFYFKLLKKNLELEESVASNVSQNALHILGRCTDPSNWDRDRQGLVMGMVQSGKTMSMLNLMALGMASGYNLIILLAGTTEGLRVQSQSRINQAFDLLGIGAYENIKEKVFIISPTHSVGYSKNPAHGANVLWPRNPKKPYDPIIIITILKQVDNLIKLNEDLILVKDFCKNQKIDFNKRYKALILDDESDNASLDIGEGTLKGINEQLVKLRENIPCNCYVGYTATPQGCVAANQNSKIGYPKDFLWLLEPMKIPGTQRNLSYLGLHEFFLLYESQITKTLSPDAWPHYQKNIKGKSEGIYNPLSKQMIPKDAKPKLAELESKFAEHLIAKKLFPQGFIDAMAEFIIGCGIRWYRYHETKFPGKPIPSLKDIVTLYPYHAVMFNLSLLTYNQEKTRNFLKHCWEIVVNSFNKWSKGKNPLFDRLWSAQLEKAKLLKPAEDISNIDEIKQYMRLAIQVTQTPIPDQGEEFIYMLNSLKESDTLNYEDQDPYKRTKKCAIFLGGNILSRGLTINNLSVSVFVRTQVSSLGDANLQMCRWFGHKLADIDLLSLYLMNGTKSLFKDITRCDDGLRASIKQSIIDNKTPTEVLIELWSSNLFNVTSNIKSKKLRRDAYSAVSYTGKVKELRDPFCNGDADKIKSVIDKFESFISQVKCKKQNEHHKRGILYEDVDTDQVRNFLMSINEISKDSLYVSPTSYAEYMDTWEDCFNEKNTPHDMPKVNIGLMGLGKIGKRQRDYVSPPSNETEAKLNIPAKIGALIGGSRSSVRKPYKGDRFFDKSEKWHYDNYDKPIGERKVNEPILILFYFIDPNYLFKFKSGKTMTIKSGDEGHINFKKALTMAVVTPLGGPQFKVWTNETIKIPK
jgi:hypothetical protein